MKKLIMATAVVAVAASMASAQVLSDNIVGYTKIDCPAGQLVLAGINFDTGGATIATMFPGTTFANTTKLYVWNKTTDAYVTATKGAFGWGAAGSTVLDNGTALWIQSATAKTVVIPGEVLTADNSVALPGLEMNSYFYPVSTAVKDMDLAAQLGVGSKIYVWNGTGYTTATKGAFGWGVPGNTVIGPSTGFWVSPAAPITWNEVVPFTP